MDVLTPPGGVPHVSVDPVPSLSAHASQLYDDLRLMPMLRQLLRTSCDLTRALGGSISLVDHHAGRYTKVAEVGTACRLGQSFPLDEGLTGQVVQRREPVALATYRDVATGHLATGHPARDGSVVAIPIWWHGDIVAVNVVFAGITRPFSIPQIDLLDTVTQLAAPGLVTAIRRELPPRPRQPDRLERLDRLDDRITPTPVADVVRGLVTLAERASCTPVAARAPLEVTVVRDGDRATLVVRTDAAAADQRQPDEPPAWFELSDADGGSLSVQAVDPPRNVKGIRPAGSGCSPLSAREHEVAAMVARGLSDRAMAESLILSRKTVEKHMGSILRKTGTTTRTAAVVRCLELGWL